MIKKLEKIFSNYQNQVILGVFFIASVLFLNLVYFNYKVIIAPYPHEYREGAMILTTQQLLDHVNPYSLDEQPQHTNVYGALYNLAVYPLALAFGATLGVHRIVSAIFILLSCSWLIYIMRRERVPLWLSLVGGVVYYSQLISMFSVIARPDSLGVFLFFCAVFIPLVGGFKNRYLIVSAIFCILSFYTKLYFIISLPIVALYIFLFKDRIRAVLYFVLSLFTLIVSAFIVNKYFPLYLTNTFFYYLNVGNYFLAGLWHVMRQLAYFSYKNFGLVFIFLILIWNYVGVNKAEFFKKFKYFFRTLLVSLKTLKVAEIECDYFLFIFIITSTAFVLKLGHNTGGFVDYIYHLITPFMIIIVFRLLTQEVLKNKFALYGVLLILGMTFTFFNHRKATDYSSQWLAIEHKLSSYKEIFNEPAVTSILVRQKKYVYDSGHSNGYLGDGMSKSPLYSEILERVKAFDAGVNEKIVDQGFDLIVLDNYSYDMISRDAISKYYQPVTTMNAPMIIDSWVLELWEPKTVIINKNKSIITK